MTRVALGILLGLCLAGMLGVYRRTASYEQAWGTGYEAGVDAAYQCWLREGGAACAPLPAVCLREVSPPLPH